MKSILVHFDGSPRCAERLELARRLSQLESGSVVALFAVTPPVVDTVYPLGAEELPIRMLYELHAGWRQRAVEAFERAATTAMWAETGLWDEPVAGFAAQALFADLLVLGQHDPELTEQLVPADFASAVLMASGRPALVLPHTGKLDIPGRRVMVAWKPTPQSARAVTAALPLLRRAERVTVVEWAPEPGGCRGAALDLKTYLALHGVQATHERQEREPPRRRRGTALEGDHTRRRPAGDGLLRPQSRTRTRARGRDAHGAALDDAARAVLPLTLPPPDC